MAKFRKKPVVIEAMQVPMPDQFYQWGRVWVFLGAKDDWRVNPNKGIDIRTLEGTMTANPGDWIIRGVNGELYPCKADIFAMTYELEELDMTQDEMNHLLEEVRSALLSDDNATGKYDVVLLLEAVKFYLEVIMAAGWPIEQPRRAVNVLQAAQMQILALRTEIKRLSATEKETNP